MRILVMFLMALLILSGCNTTYRLMYPNEKDLYVTTGDDPRSESEQPI